MKDLIRDVGDMVLGEFCSKPWGVESVKFKISFGPQGTSRGDHAYGDSTGTLGSVARTSQGGGEAARKAIARDVGDRDCGIPESEPELKDD